VGDRGVEGFGDWARLADGTITSHHWVDGELFCDLCAKQRGDRRSVNTP
jgi:hypothetical protein